MLGRLDVLPKVVGAHVLDERDGVDRPATLGGVRPETHALGEDRAGGRRLDVVLAAEDEDGNAESKDDVGSV